MISVFNLSTSTAKKQFVCLLMVAAYGLLSLLVVCPSLHQLIHPEAEHSDHHCAVTEMGDGTLISQTPVPEVFSSPLASFGEIILVEGKEVPEIEAFFPTLERGPPFTSHSILL